MTEVDAVKVAVRIRPLVKLETERGCQTVLDKVPDEPQIVFKNNENFTFNYVFTPDVAQEAVYEDAVQVMLQKLFKGYNITILAYGQTGSGKTHTMGTAFDGNFSHSTGVIPRAMNDIFKQINDMPDHSFFVSCSFMELYQEQLYDLLSNSSREQSVVDMREDGNRGIIIPGLTEIPVTTAKETTDCLLKGSSGRAVGATAMNAQSSRSHAIFTITLQMAKAGDSNSSTTSKFHLVDLAGSERSKKTKATGDRFKEGVKINQGLLALGNVISALGSSQGNGYIGYRDSKLTRLLQDSLGGNSMTLMIACVSPADYNMDETLSTLRYADRARKIKNKPIVNQDPKAAEINRLNGIIQKLRLELLNKGGSGGNVSIVTSQEINNMQEHIDNLMEKNRNLQQQLQTTLHDVADIEMRAVVAETAHDELHRKVLEVKELVTDLSKNFNEESCPIEVVEYAKKVLNIRSAIEEINGVFEKNKDDLLDHKKSISAANSALNLTNIESEAMQSKVEAFTTKQLDLNNELRRLNRELGLKEELHHKVVGNLSKFCTYEGGDNSEEKMKEFESMIQILEAEKAELCDKLKCVKDTASAKIAEDRRKRLQQLETQISDLRKKNLQQAKMLKLREKESQKIVNLNSEIQSMKAAKVKLIRSMRSESDIFRQWKLNREKELLQLKEKDRKRQNNMVRMESLHIKQRNVLKRKVEEAVAINKRLKDALDKQKTAQSQRKHATMSGKADQVISWIDHELEVILSVIDAEHSLEQLMEDRAVLTSRLQEMKDISDPKLEDLSTIEEEIQMRNAQINDLQQRVIASDIESKMKAITDGMQSMPEARTALKHLFVAIIEMRKEYATKDNKIEDLKSTCEAAEEKMSSLETEIQIAESKYKEAMSSIEKAYEEKITVLLRELNNYPQTMEENTPEMAERMKIQQQSLDKLDTVRDELEEYKRMYNEIKMERHDVKKRRDKKIEFIKFEHEEELSFISIASEDDDNRFDPDWVKTPRVRKTINSSREDTQIKETSHGSKRGSDGSFRCSCKGQCTTKRCICRKNNGVCSGSCKCTEVCLNKIKENKENDQPDGDIVEMIENDETNLICGHIPKKSKFSLEDGSDVLTPSYPFKHKKRQPFF